MNRNDHSQTAYGYGETKERCAYCMPPHGSVNRSMPASWSHGDMARHGARCVYTRVCVRARRAFPTINLCAPYTSLYLYRGPGYDPRPQIVTSVGNSKESNNRRDVRTYPRKTVLPGPPRAFRDIYVVILGSRVCVFASILELTRAGGTLPRSRSCDIPARLLWECLSDLLKRM